MLIKADYSACDVWKRRKINQSDESSRRITTDTVIELDHRWSHTHGMRIH